MTHRIFVYGLLRRGANHPMAKHLMKNAHYLGAAAFRGKLFLVNYYPGVTPSMEESSVVRGDLYEFENEELLTTLDAFEEVGPNFPSPSEYIRESRTVTLLDGKEMNAWIYLFNQPTDQLLQIESGDFLKSQSESHFR